MPRRWSGRHGSALLLSMAWAAFALPAAASADQCNRVDFLDFGVRAPYPVDEAISAAALPYAPGESDRKNKALIQSD